MQLRERFQGQQEVPLDWRKLCRGVVHCKSNVAALKLNHFKMISIFPHERKQGANEYAHREKDDIRVRRYKSSVLTDSVEQGE